MRWPAPGCVAITTRSAASRFAPDANDGRRNLVDITPTGRLQLVKLARVVTAAQDQLLAPLSAKERARFVALLTRIVEHHDAET
jgi:DNA-binding MarR family transcriptional regulator